MLQRQTQRERSPRSSSFAAGARILIRAGPLPRPPHTFCVGLASLLDRGGLPINLGRLQAAGRRTGTLLARIPAGLIGPEPPGPYLVFVGDCTVPAPMGDDGSTIIAIAR